MLQDSSWIVSEEIDATPQFEATKHQLGVRLPQTTHVWWLIPTLVTGKSKNRASWTTWWYTHAGLRFLKRRDTLSWTPGYCFAVRRFLTHRHNVEPVRLPMTAPCMPSPVQIPGRATNVSMLLQLLTKYSLIIMAPTIDYYILIPEKRQLTQKNITSHSHRGHRGVYYTLYRCI